MFEEHTSIEQKIVSMDVIKTTPEVQHDLAIKQDFRMGYCEKRHHFYVFF